MTLRSVLLVASIGGVAGAALLAPLAWVGRASGPMPPWAELTLWLLLLLALGSGVAWMAARSVTADVRHVASGVRRMVEGGAREGSGDSGWATSQVAIPNLDDLGELTKRIEQLRAHFVQSLARERELRQQAEDADRFKTEFMQTVSHELRTPLNSILGFTDVLWEEIDGPLNAAQKEDLAIIRNAGNHLMSLFNDVLDLSAAASGHLQLEFELVDVPALLEAVSSELGGLRRDRPVTVRSEAATGLPAVPADPKRLRQIVTNLGSNALKFTEQGEVVLGARLDGGWLRIEVRDTGPGIPPDEMSTVFEEFGQTVAEGKRRRGAGLGLAITRQLAELHGGEVSAESAPGEGSTFFVWLPLGQAHVGAA